MPLCFRVPADVLVEEGSVSLFFGEGCETAIFIVLPYLWDYG